MELMCAASLALTACLLLCMSGSCNVGSEPSPRPSSGLTGTSCVTSLCIGNVSGCNLVSLFQSQCGCCTSEDRVWGVEETRALVRTMEVWCEDGVAV